LLFCRASAVTVQKKVLFCLRRAIGAAESNFNTSFKVDISSAAGKILFVVFYRCLIFYNNF